MLALVVKTTVIVLAGLAVVSLARSSRASVRHAMLACTFVTLAALPLATFALPVIAWTVSNDSVLAMLVANDNVVAAPEGHASPEGQRFSAGEPTDAGAPRPRAQGGRGAAADNTVTSGSSTIVQIATVTWSVGTVALLLGLAISLYRVQRLRRSALPMLDARLEFDALAADAGIRREVDVLLHEHVAAPVTCGVMRPVVILPTDAHDWSEAERRRALVHELEHVQRHDWLVHVFARAVCAAYWFNPLVWVAYRQLGLLAEHAADDAVVARDESTSYAAQLVTLARRMAARPNVAVLGMAHRSDLSARVRAVLDDSRCRGRAGWRRRALIAVSAAAVLLLLAPLHVAAIRTPPEATNSAASNTANEQPRGRIRRLDLALVEAADDGDLAGVRELLDNGADVNANVPGDGSPLIAAAREGHIGVVRLLLDRGADVNLAVHGDGAPLIMASREGHLAIVQLLLDRGADIDRLTSGDENALIQASGSGHLELVKLLVARGANVNARTWVERVFGRDGGEWRSPLLMAQRAGHREVVEYLRRAGAVD